MTWTGLRLRLRHRHRRYHIRPLQHAWSNVCSNKEMRLQHHLHAQCSHPRVKISVACAINDAQYSTKLYSALISAGYRPLAYKTESASEGAKEPASKTLRCPLLAFWQTSMHALSLSRPRMNLKHTVSLVKGTCTIAARSWSEEVADDGTRRFCWAGLKSWEAMKDSKIQRWPKGHAILISERNS